MVPSASLQCYFVILAFVVQVPCLSCHQRDFKEVFCNVPRSSFHKKEVLSRRERGREPCEGGGPSILSAHPSINITELDGTTLSISVHYLSTFATYYRPQTTIQGLSKIETLHNGNEKNSDRIETLHNGNEKNSDR
jgi:hypothetical protein